MEGPHTPSGRMVIRPPLHLLRRHVPADAREASDVGRVQALVAAQARWWHRDTLPGHVTASAWIVDPTRTQVLLLHHGKAKRWLQPGGHWEDDPDLESAALRETREETGLTRLQPIGGLFDVDVHTIPARGAMPAHEHHDLRVLVEADPAEPLRISDESSDLRWWRLDALPLEDPSDSLHRMAAKVRESR